MVAFLALSSFLRGRWFGNFFDTDFSKSGDYSEQREETSKFQKLVHLGVALSDCGTGGAMTENPAPQLFISSMVGDGIP